MNMHKLTLLIFTVTLLFSCEKADFFTTEDDLILLEYVPDAFLCTATKEVPTRGSVNWTANTFGQIINNRLILTMITYQDTISQEQRERLEFGIIQQQVGKYPLENDINRFSAYYSRWIDDGDVQDATWRVDPAEEDNFIEIIEMDTVSRIVKGRFNVHFFMWEQGSFGLYSKKINFKDANFTVKYE